MNHMKIRLEDFPVRQETVYLNNCGVAPLYGPAAAAMAEFVSVRSRQGAGAFRTYGTMQAELRRAAADLLQTESENVAFVKNTAEALSMLANGYPFEPGDEIISYVHEYPSNHFPWLLQERRGVKLRLLPDRRAHLRPGIALTGAELPGPCAWTLEDLEELVSPRTRVVAISHVQFTSGFAADLEQLGRFCAGRGIDLVVDAAQSLGCLPLRPEEWGIAAVASSGWKWLLGPLGTGLFYTSPELRRRLSITMAGAEVVTQAPDYLDHRWQPHATARVFEYSTEPAAGVLGLLVALRELWNHLEDRAVADHAFALQDRLMALLDPDFFRPLAFEAPHRSGILSVVLPVDPEEYCRRAVAAGVFVTARGGYLRLAPHVYLTLEDMDRAASILNDLARQE